VSLVERGSDPQAQLQEALDLSFTYLGRRDRTAAEVRRHLERKRMEPAVIDGAIAELERQGYLDDARYAQRFAEDRRRLDAWGAERIERRLRALGVEPEDIRAAIGADDDSELDAALALLRRRFPEPPTTPRDAQRALGVLVRKGYELEVAYDALRRHAGVDELD
jgi:regulatory protein